jgi:hypothetical protein
MDFNSGIGNRMVVNRVSIYLRCYAYVRKDSQTAKKLINIGSLTLTLFYLCSWASDYRYNDLYAWWIRR